MVISDRSRNHFLSPFLFRSVVNHKKSTRNKNGQVYVKRDDVIIDAEQWYLFLFNKSIARAVFFRRIKRETKVE